jgi:HNH endonuclease
MKPQSAITRDVCLSLDGRIYHPYFDSAGSSRRLYEQRCNTCNVSVFSKKFKGTCRKCYKMSEETKSKISMTLRNKYTDPQYKKRVLSTFNPAKGPKHWNWQGGKTSINQRERGGEGYTQWRNTIFARDNYTCQGCKMKSDKLHAHHIIPWAVSVELRFEVSNGISLCQPCHKIIHNYMGVLYQTSIG